jgi:HKD family nuclease
MTLITTNLNKALEQHLKDYPNPKRVDIISSYIRKEGLEIVRPIFETLKDQDAIIRIISTFNRKITDVASIQWLAKLDKAEVYIFEPSLVNFHAKSWCLRYEDEALDTVIIGSSNLTGTGVSAAVEWNLLLQRGKHANASKAIDYAALSFIWYINDPDFAGAFIRWDVDAPDYERFKGQVEGHLIKDEELMEEASSEVKERWGKLTAEMEQLRADEKERYLAQRSGYHTPPRRPFDNQVLPSVTPLSGNASVDDTKTLPLPFPSELDTAGEERTHLAQNIKELLESPPRWHLRLESLPDDDQDFVRAKLSKTTIKVEQVPKPANLWLDLSKRVLRAAAKDLVLEDVADVTILNPNKIFQEQKTQVQRPIL